MPGAGANGKLVEIIDGLMTDPAATDALTDLAKRLGREPVRIADTPGFVVEQLLRLYCLEAANIAAEGGATFATLDRILKEGCGFAKGPFELMDQLGLDVAQAATERLYRSTFEEPRFRPTPLMQLRLDGGALGRRAGRGFYDYDAGGAIIVPEEGRMPHYDERWVWVSPDQQRISIRIKSIVKACGGVLDEGKEAHPKSLLVVTPIGEDATTCVVRQGLDPERAVAVDALFGLITRRTVMKTPVTRLGYAACALGLFSGGGAKASLIHDTPGFVAQRVVAALINAAAAIAQSGVAAPEDIDRAAGAFEAAGKQNGILAFSLELPLATARHAVDIAVAHGLKVLIDPGGMQDGVDYSLLLTEKVHLLKPNQHETKMLTGVEVRDEADAATAAAELKKRYGIRRAVLTMGAGGAFACDEGRVSHLPIPKVPDTGVRDETGCGDQFMAALCVALQEGMLLKDAAAFGIQAATIQFSRVGIDPVHRDDMAG